MSGSTTAEDVATPVSQLPWQTIPKFVPGTTDMTEYTKKVEFLQRIWPPEHLSLLAPRMALMCEGTAFKKVSLLDSSKLRATDGSGVALIVRTLGGNWGLSQSETRYDTFEKAIYQTSQRPDETHESYIARHDVQFEELKALNVTLEEFRAYILLRQSGLPAEDRKKIVIDNGGQLEYGRMCSAIRLLGSRVFGDLQGSKTTARTKTYDANFVETPAENDEHSHEGALVAHHASYQDEGDGDIDEAVIEALVSQEDPDALQVAAFEGELEGFFQETPELHSALISYLDARQRLRDKGRVPGFWPVQGGKGKGARGRSFSKGSAKGKKGSSSREALLQRIARSHCRLCGERGHWRAECPRANAGTGGASSRETPAGVAQAAADEGGSEIFDELPQETLPAFMCAVNEAVALFLDEAHKDLTSWTRVNPEKLRSRLRNLVQKSRPKLNPCRLDASRMPCEPPEAPPSSAEPEVTSEALACTDPSLAPTQAILDTGASKCVMGDDLLREFLKSLSPTTRKEIREAPSAVRFRFGNNQTLTSMKKVLLPLKAEGQKPLWLAVEIVRGQTPFLFSKRALKQLGGKLCTISDQCELTRLGICLRLDTNASGLYKVDVASLCENPSTQRVDVEPCFSSMSALHAFDQGTGSTSEGSALAQGSSQRNSYGEYAFKPSSDNDTHPVRLLKSLQEPVKPTDASKPLKLQQRWNCCPPRSFSRASSTALQSSEPHASARGERAVHESAALSSHGNDHSHVPAPSYPDASPRDSERRGEPTSIERVPGVGPGAGPSEGIAGEAIPGCSSATPAPQDAASSNGERPRAGYDAGSAFCPFRGRTAISGDVPGPPRGSHDVGPRAQPDHDAGAGAKEDHLGTKHRGKEWRSVCLADPQYLTWMLGRKWEKESSQMLFMRFCLFFLRGQTSPQMDR